jgi:hypothetical protein
MSRTWLSFLVGSALAVLLIICVDIHIADAQAPIVPVVGYTQDFNTLANTAGVTLATNLPTGWTFVESGTSVRNNSAYAVGDGSSNAGDTYSFGAAGSTDRAFGGLMSSSLVYTLGVQLQNATGSTVGQLSITYYCEQWRQGTAGRVDRLDFQYSTDATSLATGTWTDVNALDCPGTDTGSVGAKDGNTLRQQISNAITGLNLANGATIWLRWVEFNATLADDGLALDDLTITASSPNAITLRALGASSGLPGWLAIAPVAGFLAVGGLGLLRLRHRV